MGPPLPSKRKRAAAHLRHHQLNEFDIIKRFFLAGRTGEGLKIGPGDDCAVVEVSGDEELLMTTDTLVEGVHFPNQSMPANLAYRSCATALSDIAAMGGRARWASLALTAPDFDEEWFESFVAGFKRALAIDSTSLIGGDLTRGPLSITWHITGTTTKNSAILRSGAQINDQIYVTGNLGGAAYALEFLQQESTHPSLGRYWSPIPRLDLARKIAFAATSCIDISDGFLADLSHILRASKVAATVDCDAIPSHGSLSELNRSQRLVHVLSGGDDYELCFTANPKHEAKLNEISQQCEVEISRVGTITESKQGPLIRSNEGEALSAAGYQHF